MSGAAVAHAGPVPGLEARSLYRFYHAGDDEVLALRGVSLQVWPGELIAVTGPSGSGKSTLLACLAGIDDPDGGTVYVSGERMSRVGERRRGRLRASALGVLLQSGNLIAHLSVSDNVKLARRLAGRKLGGDVRRDLEPLGIGHCARAMPETLSGGEAARAGLAVALANDPPVLLADEPTGELDGDTEREVVDLLVDQAVRGRTVLVVTHSPVLAGAAGRVIDLLDGQVVEGSATPAVRVRGAR